MSEDITQRITRNLKTPELIEVLSRLPGSDLHSLLLAVLKCRVASIDPAQLKRPNAASQASDVDSRLLHEVERAAYHSAGQFAAIELSPLDPLGALHLLTGLDQANTVSTIRAFECTSDPTLGLAIECARRRQSPADRRRLTRLCAIQRVTRFPVPRKPGMTAHFKLFSLLSGARDEGSFSFEIHALREHINVYLSFLANLRNKGFAFENVVVEISDTRAIAALCSRFGVDQEEIRASVKVRDPGSSERLLARYSSLWPGRISRPAEDLAEFDLPEHVLLQLGAIEREVCTRLAAEHKSVCFRFNMHRLNGLGYYRGPCFQIAGNNVREEFFSLADGGFVDWTRRMLLDEKERLLTSAVGIELLCRLFMLQHNR
ncbi:MAG TPA: hypothetical protein VGK64_16775 [Bryobacteraceae bacterium]